MSVFSCSAGSVDFAEKKTDTIYFWTEFATAFAFVLIAIFGAENIFFNLFFVSILIFLASFDARFGEIPDEVSLPAVVLALIFAANFSVAIIGAIVGGGFFTALVVASNGRWMGGGDIRLGLLLGILTGWRGFAIALFVASFVGSIFGIVEIIRNKKKLKSAIPFGPFLVIGGIVAILFTEKICDWYLGFLF